MRRGDAGTGPGRLRWGDGAPHTGVARDGAQLPASAREASKTGRGEGRCEVTDPTTGQWRDLHAAFADFCRAEPWHVMDDEDVVTVEDPSRGQTGHGVVMGAAGLEYGLALYLGDEGLATYLATMTDAVEPDSEEAFDMLNAAWALLTDREDLAAADLAVIRTLGLRYRGRGRWPLFRRLMPGYVPWYLDADEAAFLTLALRAVIEVASHRASRDEAAAPEPGPALISFPTLGDGPEQSEWGAGEPFPPTAPVPDYPRQERLRQVARSGTRGAAVWEWDSFNMRTPIQERKGERPYYPTMILVVDGRSGLVLSGEILGARPSATEKRDTLLALLERVDALPREIVVDSMRSAQLVEPIAEGLGIGLSLGDTPALAEAREEIRDGFPE